MRPVETVRIQTADDMEKLGVQLGSKACPGDVIGLSGPLGAGKTTLVKGIARGLDIADTVTSPSFTLISEYEGRMPLYHMDLYRIRSEEEFSFLGVDEMLYGTGLSVVEWFERAGDVLPERRTEIDIAIGADGVRQVTIREAK